MKVIICRIGEEEYALDVNYILSIERMQVIRSLPHSPEYMAGIMHLRGMVIAVMDLRLWLGFNTPADTANEETRILVIEHNQNKLGLIVDAATDVQDIPEHSLQDAEIQRGNQEIRQVADLDGRSIMILNTADLMERLH